MNNLRPVSFFGIFLFKSRSAVSAPHLKDCFNHIKSVKVWQDRWANGLEQPLAQSDINSVSPNGSHSKTYPQLKF